MTAAGGVPREADRDSGIGVQDPSWGRGSLRRGRKQAWAGPMEGLLTLGGFEGGEKAWILYLCTDPYWMLPP